MRHERRSFSWIRPRRSRRPTSARPKAGHLVPGSAAARTAALAAALLGASFSAPGTASAAFTAIGAYENTRVSAQIQLLGIPIDQNYSSASSLMGGALASFALGSGIEFELGGLYGKRQFYFGTSRVAHSVVNASATGRYWTSQGLSFGVGVFADPAFGALLVDSTPTTFGASGWSAFDAGLLLQLGVYFPARSPIGIFLDFRGQWGLAHLYASADVSQVTSTTYAFVFGLRFGAPQAGAI